VLFKFKYSTDKNNAKSAVYVYYILGTCNKYYNMIMQNTLENRLKIEYPRKYISYTLHEPKINENAIEVYSEIIIIISEGVLGYFICTRDQTVVT